MTFLDAVLQSEQEADIRIKDAKKRAEEIIKDAQLQKDALLSSAKEIFLEKRNSAVQGQKEELKDVYRSIIAGGRNTSSELERIASLNTNRGEAFILESL